MIYIISGVSGIGKTTIGKLLAESLSLPFYDGDDFHSEANKTKMADGVPLDDDDRLPWLRDLSDHMLRWNAGKGAVLACSALKEMYRDVLRSEVGADALFILLHADFETVRNRLKERTGHFMNINLLASQFETLEIPAYGIHINANNSVKNILKQIMKKIDNKSEIGILGLGIMGKSLALNLARKGISLSVYNRQVPDLEVDVAKRFIQENDGLAVSGFDSLELFVESLSVPRTILLMVPAGAAVDNTIRDLKPLLNENDLIIDGGNSHFEDSIRRHTDLKNEHLNFIDMGVSGGEKGALEGPALMPAGAPKVYARVAPILNNMAARDRNNNACSGYIGPAGSGHFVKMVHNGIEYAEMQLIAEMYHFLRYYQELNPEEIASVFSTWSASGSSSFLLDITIDILRTKEGDEYLVDLILDKAAQKGTGGWSVNAALSLGRPLDTIVAAVMSRYISAMKSERVNAAGHYQSLANPINVFDHNKLKNAYQGARIINHAIGFDLLRESSIQNDWNLNLSEIARIWTSGCIIRSELMEEFVRIFNDFRSQALLHPNLVSSLLDSKGDLISFVCESLHAGCSLAVHSAALNYFLGFSSAQSPANLIQAQRDYFGAHGFHRLNEENGDLVSYNWNDKS